MTKEIYTNEMMSLESLDNVAGGTVAELHELTKAMAGNGSLANFLTGAVKLTTCTFPVTNIPLADETQDKLKKLNIDAYISVGWFGTGKREVGNRYSMNGNSMTHGEVVEYLKAWRNR